MPIIFNFCKKEGDGGYDDELEIEQQDNAENIFENLSGSDKRNQIAQIL